MQDKNLINEILINRFLGNELSEDETNILEEWLKQDDNQELYKNILDKEWIGKEFGIIDKLNKNKEDDRDTIKARVAGKKSKFIDLRRYTWWRYAAAAVLILVAGTIFFIVTKTNEKPGNEITQASPKQDIAPGKQSATLKLADGSTIVLDSSAIGKLAQQGSTQVLNKNGELVYENPSPIGGSQKGAGTKTSVRYNTLSTSRGQTYPLILSDNSRVWLNSESSIRFPVSFTGKERKVEITGEVYFEIAHDAAKPFTVSVNGMDVQVLGTKFNVNAYTEEGAIKTTLLEGSVKVSSAGVGARKVVIRPGQQAQVIANEITITDNVDIEKIIAWKNGFFTFRNDKLGDVMGDIARWYNIEVVFEGNAGNVEVAGDIHRTSNLSEVLKILSLLKVESRIEGRKLILKAQ